MNSVFFCDTVVVFFHLLLVLLCVISHLLGMGYQHEEPAVLPAHRQRKKEKNIRQERPPYEGSIFIQSSMPPGQAHWVRAISALRTLSLRVDYLHRRFRWFLFRTGTKRESRFLNGYVTAGAAAECEVIHELLAVMTSSAKPEGQNDVAKAWIGYASNASVRSSTGRSKYAVVLAY